MCKNKQRVTINYSVNLALRACIVVADVNLSILTDVVPSILLITDVTLFFLGKGSVISQNRVAQILTPPLSHGDEAISNDIVI